LRGGAIGYGFRQTVPLAVLRGAEIRPGENFLEAQHLHTGIPGLLDVGEMGLGHCPSMGFTRLVGIGLVGQLNHGRLDDA
jgi:hypothetical protein